MAPDDGNPEKSFGIVDPEAFAHNLVRLLEETGKAAEQVLDASNDVSSQADVLRNDIKTYLEQAKSA